MTHNTPRRPWREGPGPGVRPNSWLAFNDDDLLHQIETLDPQLDVDNLLLEVVQSDRHFFIRQEAAKRIRKKNLLFAYEDDRHIGQILVRHLTRREDITYLERLVARSQHSEVRTAAQVQLARVRKRLAEAERTSRPAAALHERREAPPPLPAAWRVAIVHRDAKLRQLVSETLPQPEFEVAGFAPGEQGLHQVQVFDPHLIMADVRDLIEQTALPDAIRRRANYVPLVVLCQAELTESLTDLLGHGADEFFMLPVQPALLTAKTRALVHFAHRSATQAARRPLSGVVGAEGVLPLLKLCEEQQLTCRLVVTTEGERRFLDFIDGEMTDAGGGPARQDEEALAALLAVRSGTFEITESLSDERVNAIRPTGVVAKAATAQHPPAQAQPRPERDSVDATLLGWAIHFIVEQAWCSLGTTVTMGLLRRTHQELLQAHPALRYFEVEENAHVSVDLSRGVRLPGGAVVAVAFWMAAFLAEAGRLVTDVSNIQVRQATALMAEALDQTGFYTAYDVAIGNLSRS